MAKSRRNLTMSDSDSPRPAKKAKFEKPSTNLDYWDDAVAHLTGGSDTVMTDLISKYSSDGKAVLKANGDPFRTIVKAIVGQQISVKAADAVWKRFEAKVGATEGGTVRCVIFFELLKASQRVFVNLKVLYTFDRPDVVASADVLDLKEVGLSMRKAEYIRGIGTNLYNFSSDFQINFCDMWIFCIFQCKFSVKERQFQFAQLV